ncbi:MAG TPA: type II toxin-antitoxin system VapC family toxin [Gemmatimonadota bacterium]|nr:type II toxin-antitoxin system VapC family toxin [Gemmatimonadota bacterium]
MIFVDTNVFMYAVGRDHPLRKPARDFFERSLADRTPLVTSAEVLQELLHAYLPVGRIEILDAAFFLAEERMSRIWSVEPEDVKMARLLIPANRGLRPRDLLHLACCRRRDVTRIHTYDQGLAAAPHAGG